MLAVFRANFAYDIAYELAAWVASMGADVVLSCVSEPCLGCFSYIVKKIKKNHNTRRCQHNTIQ